MSPERSAAPDGRSTRGPRTAVAAVAVLVLVLVAVLVGLLGRGGSDDVGAPASAGPTVTSATRTATAPGRAPSTNRPSAAPTAPTVGGRDPDSGLRVVALSSLPREAQTTVRLIDAGGPFPYVKDGATFRNREGVLPSHPRGWYREYTVRTPGEGDRGARRIVTGDADRLVFYTADHYDSFVRVAR